MGEKSRGGFIIYSRKREREREEEEEVAVVEGRLCGVNWNQIVDQAETNSDYHAHIESPRVFKLYFLPAKGK